MGITTTMARSSGRLAEWVSLSKSLRPLLHGGELVRLERPNDPGSAAFGVVAEDRSEALFAFIRSQTIAVSEAPPLRLDGLDAGARYSVKRLHLPGERLPVPGQGRCAAAPSRSPSPVRCL